MIIYTTSRIEREIDKLCVFDEFSKNFKYHYLFLISHIRSYHFFDRRYESYDYVPVYLKLLRQFVSHNNAGKFLKNLVSVGILETDGFYQKGKKAYGYRVKREYLEEKFNLMEIKDRKLLNKLSTKFNKEKDNILYRTDSYGYITKCMEDLKIDSSKAKKYIENMDDGERKNSYIIANDFFNYKFATIDEAGNRLHNNLTNIATDLRPFITYKGKTITQVDIKNSQPLFLYLMMKDKYFIPEEEMDKYKKVVCEYGFYEFFAEKLSFKLDKENRKEFKQKIFGGVLFDRNRKTLSKYENVFKQEFPMIFHVVRNIKDKEYTDVAKMLQKTESKFIFGCVDKIRIEDKIPLFTIHDSIASTLGNEKLIEKVIREEFYKQYTINIKLNIEKFL